MLILISLFIISAPLTRSQNPSPCPEIFSYEPRGQEEDRWYGVISLQTSDDLDGVWLKVILDRPAELLGNWFGEATSNDNQQYTIKNSNYKLEAGPPVSVRFFVKYNLAVTIPSLRSIKLNGKTICTSSKEDVVTSTPQLHISQTRAPVPSFGDFGNRPSHRPSGGTSVSSSSNNNNNERETISQNNNFGSSSQQRPSGGNVNQKGSGFSAGQQRPLNNSPRPEQTTVRNEVYTTKRRPGTSQSNLNSNSNNNNRRENEAAVHSGSTSNYNSLSAEGETSNGDSEFFPGDFAIHRPSQVRPASRPAVISKRNVACGTVAMKASPLISHGQNTTHGQWPWHVALYHTQGAQLMYTCGATLISENHILTAAHCVAKPQTNRHIDISKLSVYLGKFSLKRFGTGTQDREVSEIFIHPQYNYSVYFNDVAVLKLKDPVDITNYVRPCCLWEDGPDIDHVLNKLGTVVGWGFDEDRQISDVLMQAQMPIVSTVNCIYSNREFFSQFTFEKTYCAGFRNGTTVCNGDSGGGMVFPKSGTSGNNAVWQIRGIVSVGVALQGQGVCDPNHYIVFTDVAKHLDWIKRVMNE